MSDPIRAALSAELAALLSLDPEVVAASLAVPKDPSLGDLALPAFRFAKEAGSPPPALASAWAEALTTEGTELVERAAAAGPYLNMHLDPARTGSLVLAPILSDPDAVARREPSGKRVVIDYSSPNVAKPLHIGHLHGTVLGNSLARILERRGHEVVGVNHLGDWGTQFGRAAVAWERWGSEAELGEALEAGTGARYLVSLYVRFHDEVERIRTEEGLGEDAETFLEVEARDWFRQLEEGSAEHRRLWEQLVNISLAECQRVYARLGVAFDHYTGESFYIDRIPAAVERLEEAGILEDSEGAQVVDVKRDEEDSTPPFLVRKSDGATLYATRDLAAALYRLEEFDPWRVLYVVGSPQKLHFEQLFRVLERLEPGLRERFVHVDYAHTRLKGRKMATRSGDVVYLEDVLDEARRHVREKLEENLAERGDYLEIDPEELCDRVACAALFFGYLRPDRKKETTFDWETAFELQGDTGPGVMYTHAQLRSILRKAGGSDEKPDWSLLTEPEERQLLRLLNDFHLQVEKAADALSPSPVCGHLLEVRQLVNSYLRKESLPRIIELEGPLRATRLALVEATAEVLRTGLLLLGIRPTDQM